MDNDFSINRVQITTAVQAEYQARWPRNEAPSWKTNDQTRINELTTSTRTTRLFRNPNRIALSSEVD